MSYDENGQWTYQNEHRMTARQAIANFLLWYSHDMYASPPDAADSLLRRLAHEGYEVVGLTNRGTCKNG